MADEKKQSIRYLKKLDINIFSTLSIVFFIIFISIYISSVNFIFFHTVSELFSFTIALSIFIIAINSYDISKSTFLIILGVGLGFAGVFDILHALSYDSITVITHLSQNLTTQLWVSARVIWALTLMSPIRTFSKSYNLQKSRNVIYGLIVFSIVTLIPIFYFPIFPTCLVEGRGITQFKAITEFIVCYILFYTITETFKIRNRMNYKLFVFMELSQYYQSYVF